MMPKPLAQIPPVTETIAVIPIFKAENRPRCPWALYPKAALSVLRCLSLPEVLRMEPHFMGVVASDSTEIKMTC